MRANGIYRARLQVNSIWPHRRGLRAPAVHITPRHRDAGAGAARGDDRAAQAMGATHKQTVQ
jgi:hypothetical protein